MKKSNWYLYGLQTAFLLPVIYYWLDSRNWNISDLDILAVFPLLGLLAFVMMWFHLMVAYLKRTRPQMFEYKDFYRKTSNIVLILIILHPLLLIIKASGLGILAIDWSGESQRPYVLMGVLALLVFLGYEIIERLREKPLIKNNWEVVSTVNRVAFILIFIHGIQLGQHLQAGWLRGLWLFFGFTTAGYFIWVYYQLLIRKKPKTS